MINTAATMDIKDRFKLELNDLAIVITIPVLHMSMRATTVSTRVNLKRVKSPPALHQ